MRKIRQRRRRRSHRGQMTAALISLALLATACGGGDDQASASAGTEGGPASTDDGATEATAAAECVEADVRFNHIMGEGSFITDSVVAWAEEVTDATDGRVQFEHFYGSSLLAPSELIPGFRDGRAEGVYYSAAYTPQESPLASILTAAGIDSDPEVQIRTMTDLVTTNDQLQSEFADNNGVALWVAPLDPYVLAASEPITSLDELSGKRVRVPGGVAAVFEEYGASTTFTSSEEVYEAVQRGLVDGVMFPWHLVVGSGVYEVAPHITGFPRLVNNAGTVTLHADVFNSLCEEDQQTIRNISADFVDASLEELAEAEASACEELRAVDGSARLLEPNEMAEFDQAMGTAGLEAWRADVIEMGVSEEDVDAFIDAYTAKQDEYAEAADEYAHPAETCEL